MCVNLLWHFLKGRSKEVCQYAAKEYPMWIHPKRLLSFFAILSTTVSAPTYAQSETPDWLSIHGESRVRYQSTQNQFRVNRSGGDQLLLFRTLVDIKADTGPITFGLELQDSRAYLDYSGTPLTSSTFGPLTPANLSAPGVRFEIKPNDRWDARLY